MRKALRFTAAAVSFAFLALPVAAGAASFTDIPDGSPVQAAASYLVSKGIVQDGTSFRPDDALTRAQAAKILVAPLLAPEALAQYTSSPFADVPPGQWYTSYVEAARILGLVNSGTAFKPSDPVTKAAFVKMLLSSKKIDYVSNFADFTDPLSADVRSPADWYYAPMRYAIASSMFAVNSDGSLGPADKLTRGDMALLYYHLDMYRAGRRSQALLSETETEIGNVLNMLQAKDAEQARWAASRSVIASRGALASNASTPIVKGAVKVAEGFRFLVQSYEAGMEGRLDEAIARAKEAYASAEKAKSFSSGLNNIVSQMQTIAKNMADQARELQAQ